MPDLSHDRTLIVYLAAVAGTAVIVGAALPGATVAMAGMGVIALAALWRGVRVHHPEPVGVWVALGSSIPVLVGAEVVSSVFHADLLVRPYLSFVRSGLLLAAFVALLVGVTWATRRATGDSDRAVGLDTMILLVAAGSVVGELVIDPLFSTHRLSTIVRVTSAIHPVFDVALMVAILRLVVVNPRRSWAGIGVAVAVATGLASDLVNAFAVATASSSNVGLLGNPALARVGWLLTPSILGATALCPSMVSLTERAPDRRSGFPLARSVAMGASLLAPAAAMTANITLLHLRPDGFDALEWLLPFALLATLIIARTVMSFRETVESEARSAGQERRLQRLVQNLTDLVLIVDRDGVVTYQSPSVATVLGDPAATLVGTRALAMVDPGDRTAALALTHKAMRDPGCAVEGVIHSIGSDGRRLTFEMRQTDQRRDPAIGGIVAVLHDVTDRVEFENELRRQAMHDALTGLPNRALIEERLSEVLARSTGDACTSAVLYVDLDNFKDVNDGLGHRAGDELLRMVALRLLRGLREGDIVGRLGGDEFVIISDRVPDDRAATALAHRVLDSLATPFELTDARGRRVSVSASIGIARCSGAVSASEIVRNADVALYEAKAQGKRCAVLFEDAMQLVALRRFEQEMDLKKALHDDELVVHYQPIVDLRSMALSGVEALVRWNHPERGLLGPSEFVDLAEETGQIVDIGRWVLRRACTDVARLRRQGVGPISLAVNVSARQLETGAIVAEVQSALEDSGLEPQALVLEVTETAVMRDARSAIGRVEELKALGIKVAIDDFGTGYSSMAYLQQLPVDVLKIDRTFITRVTGHEGTSMVRTFIQLARLLGLRVVAEGIEDEDQLEVLQEEGCDKGQGYLFSPPIEVEHLPGVARHWAQVSTGVALSA